MPKGEGKLLRFALRSIAYHAQWFVEFVEGTRDKYEREAAFVLAFANEAKSRDGREETERGKTGESATFGKLGLDM